MCFRDKLKKVKRYNSFQEKEALLSILDEDSIDIINTSKILGLSPVNKLEAEALIMKAREISVSESIELTSSCPNCDYINMTSVDIPSMFFKGEIDSKIPEGIYEDLSEVDIEGLEDLELDKYNELENKLESNNKNIFDNVVEINCLSCKYKYQTKIEPLKFISKFSISNLYEQYSDITYYSHMNKSDVDNMYPFEREIFIGLIQKKEDEKDSV